jgi:hypothetical protein
VFTIEGQPVVAGLVLHTQKPTSLGQFVVEHDAKWLDILRIK